MCPTYAPKAAACRAPSTASWSPEHSEQGPALHCNTAAATTVMQTCSHLTGEQSPFHLPQGHCTDGHQSRALWTHASLSASENQRGYPVSKSSTERNVVTGQMPPSSPHGTGQPPQQHRQCNWMCHLTAYRCECSHETSTCSLPYHPHPEVSVLPCLSSLSSHVTTPLYTPQLFSGYRKRQKLFQTK